jgi:hypothetical protein
MSLELVAPLLAAGNSPLAGQGPLASLAPHVTRLGVLAAGLAVGVLLVWCYSRLRPRREKESSPHDPFKLFGELCQAHRLTAAQRRLLEWLVAERQLLQPALVFLDPILLESAIAHADSPQVRKRLTELRSKLFAALESTAAAEGVGR